MTTRPEHIAVGIAILAAGAYLLWVWIERMI